MIANVWQFRRSYRQWVRQEKSGASINPAFYKFSRVSHDASDQMHSSTPNYNHMAA
jgi:hypothetical protein